MSLVNKPGNVFIPPVVRQIQTDTGYHFLSFKLVKDFWFCFLVVIVNAGNDVGTVTFIQRLWPLLESNMIVFPKTCQKTHAIPFSDSTSKHPS